jgi:pimeloyl-ACP methyl ester carboxylesterase
MDLEVDGRTAHAATGGVDFDPAERLVVFLHGAGMDHTMWVLQSRYFAHNRRAVLAVDLPGHGRSAGPPLASVGELAAWVWRLVDAAGGGEAALVGHSMGALAALEAAAVEPARASALVLLGATAEMPVNEDLLAAARDDTALAERLVVSWAYGRRGHIGGMRAPGLWMIGGGLSLLERAGDGVLYADLAACNAYRGGLDAAARIACPTLLVCGEDDRMTPARNAGPLAAAIAAAETTVIGDAGHMMMVEQPDRTLDALKAFL